MGRQVHACLDRSAVGVAWAEGDAFGRHLDRDVVIGVGEDRDAGGARRQGARHDRGRSARRAAGGGGPRRGGGKGARGGGRGGGGPPPAGGGGLYSGPPPPPVTT